MWYDRLKESRILVHRGTDKKGVERNAFWYGHYDPKTFDVHLRWGRIGTKGQSKIKGFGSEHAAIRFLDDKYHEKMRKGYVAKIDGESISESKLDELHIMANIVGTANKQGELEWLEKTDNGYKKIDVDRLYEPECNPAIRVKFHTRKDYNGRNTFNLIFEGEKVYDGMSGDQITSSHPLNKMITKIEEALGRSLSGA